MAKPIVRLKDIAEKTGVSINTVSRALRDCSDIGEDTKKNIKQIADEMGYVPNTFPDFIRSGRSNFIGVVVSSTTNPYFTICINEFVKRIQGMNFFPMILICQNGVFDKELLLKLVTTRVCGIVSFSDVTDDVADWCHDYKIPLVLVGIKPRTKFVNAIYADDYKCGLLVGEEFLRQNKSRPCYINCESVSTNIYRRQGFLDKISSKALKVDEYHCRFEDGPVINKALSKQIISNQNDFIFCFNDEIASVIMDLLDKEGYTGCEVFGVDGISKYLHICRKIPSVGADFEYIVRRCVEILLKKIDRDEKYYQEMYAVSLMNT